jgi:hypothetical protein
MATQKEVHGVEDGHVIMVMITCDDDQAPDLKKKKEK